MTDKLFTVVGISAGVDGQYKVRHANDINRVKMLQRAGHTDIRLAELPEPMTKYDAVLAIEDMDDFQDIIAAQVISEYLSTKAPKAVNKPKAVTVAVVEEEPEEEFEDSDNERFQQVLNTIPKRDEKGHFIKATVREEMAHELLALCEEA